jgi:hypothetical protein
MMGRNVVLVSVLIVHVAIMAWTDCCNSPVKDEVGHLPAGIYLWQTGRFDLYPVNPPLVRAIAALPVLLFNPKTDWHYCTEKCDPRPEWVTGEAFIQDNGGEQSCWLFSLARWACIPFSILGGCICYCWARELYGGWSGVVAIILWCFCPNVLAWGATICPDVAAAALGITAHYAFWRWLKSPDWTKAVIAGILLGIAQLTKLTWIILFAVWPAIWMLWNWSLGARCKLRQTRQLVVIGIMAINVLNLGYLFDGTFKMLGDYRFTSRMLAGADSVIDGQLGGNRFSRTWMGLIPVPFPEAYVTGIDLQKIDFEAGKPSYLFGEWRNRGWWHYYLVCIAFKVPLGSLLLGLLAIVSSWTNRDVAGGERLQSSATWRDETFLLLLPASVVFILVSSETGFSRYFRYVLPCFPFIYIWISRAARPGCRKLQWLATGALAWSVTSSILVCPHNISYFNELAGGPIGGHRYLLDANIDWGQDLLYLKRWVNEHPEAKPLHMAHEYFATPEMFGITTCWSPSGPVSNPSPGVRPPENIGPKPGWYAMSVDRIHTPEYEYFLRFKPMAMAGYSIYIYHISLCDANRVRKELGLPELSQELGEG